MQPSADPIIPRERFEIFATNLDHPECLAFDRDGNLWAGGEAGQVYRVDKIGKVEQITTLGSFNGGIAFSPLDDALYVCNPASGIVRVERSGKHQVFATHAGDHKLICPNFPVFDRDGNLYVSDSGQFQKRTGRLVRFKPTGKGETLIAPFGYANGLALTPDESTLYMVESDTDSIHRITLATMQIEPYATEVGRMPDGLALDAAGNLYASCYASDDIHRIDAITKQKSLFAHDRWAILLSRPTNIAFGGDDLSTLYVANLGRTTITRAKIGICGQPLANQRV